MALLSSSSRQPSHDVFLSFRGEDTRNNFLCYLYQALQAKGIEPYLDSKELPKGEEITWALMKAIEESKISAIVFSENYASSSWCLEELFHIMQCWRLREQFVVPIFYHVNPSDVRKQTGRYEKAFIEHERNMTETDKVQRWRNALAEAGTLGGWHIAGDKSELKVIEEIVQVIMNKLSSRNAQSDYKGLVGMGPKLEQIKTLLCIGEEGVRMIGIWGMGGIGKTTLGRAIYEEVSGQFESCCLVLNVRHQMSEKCGAITLRNELLSTLLNEENYYLHVVTPKTGSAFMKNRLRCKRVLVMLDDVNDFEQFEKLEISHDHLGSGSRIIVTSRDKQVLTNGPVDEVYEVKELNYHDSIQLFSIYAFKQNHLIDDFGDLSAKVLEYAKGLPIALKVLGSTLHKRNKEYWKSTLNKLKQHPDPKIFDLLKISFDGLDDLEKNIFLDMACFLKWYIDRERTTRILDGIYTDGMAYWAISNLVDKCLLTEDDNILSMHDLLQEMGRQIVWKESNNPGRRSRLWALEDVCRVLKSNMGTESIGAISLDISQIKTPLKICPSTFEKMVNLVFLHFQHESFDTEGRNKLLLANQELTYLPDALRYFYWEDCPLKSLPSDFSPSNLVELWLPNSKIEQLWNGNQDVLNLRVMFLYGCKNLRKIPNLLGATKLEILWCHGCKSLVELPLMVHLTSLKTLNLNHCSITKFPEIPTNGALEELSLAGTQIEEVPSFIGALKKLQSVNMSGTKVQTIPGSLFKLNALREINLSDCPNLTELNLNMTPTEGMPSSISRLQKILTTLDVTNCRSLKSVSKAPRRLQVLQAYGCTSLEDRYDHHVFALCGQHEFHNYFNLSQDARNNMVAVYPSIRSQHLAKESAKCLAENKWEKLPDSFLKRIHVLLYLPGSKIPDNFEHQSGNSSITVKLGSATSRRFLCFAPCLVLPIQHCQYSKLLSIHCECELKGTDGDQNFKRLVHKWQKLIRVGWSSEYLFLLFNENMVHRDMHYKEASFDFHVVAEECSTDDKVDDCRKVIKVKKCGVRVFYVDAESFTVSDVGSNIINCHSDEDNRCSSNIIRPNSLVDPSLLSPKFHVCNADFQGSMVEEDTNVENEHDDPARTMWRPATKRILSLNDDGDQTDKRLKIPYSY